MPGHHRSRTGYLVVMLFMRLVQVWPLLLPAGASWSASADNLDSLARLTLFSDNLQLRVRWARSTPDDRARSPSFGPRCSVGPGVAAGGR